MGRAPPLGQALGISAGLECGDSASEEMTGRSFFYSKENERCGNLIGCLVSYVFLFLLHKQRKEKEQCPSSPGG